MHLNKANNDVWQQYFDQQQISETYKENSEFVRTAGNFFVTTNSFDSLNQAVKVSGSSDTNLLIFRCLFSSCFSNTAGASIYFYQGSIIIYQVCGLKSTVNPSKEGVFCFSRTVEKTNHLNAYIDSTICDCGQPGVGESTNHFYFGNFSCISTNISKNKGNLNVIFYIGAVTSNNIKYCTFAENECVLQVSRFNSGISSTITKCNIIDNDSKYQYIFTTGDQIYFDECCILRNTARKQIIEIEGRGSVTMNKCNYDGDMSSVTVLAQTNSFNNELMHLIYGDCEAAYIFKCNLKHQNECSCYVSNTYNDFLIDLLITIAYSF